jgi:hypothetical protein
MPQIPARVIFPGTDGDDAILDIPLEHISGVEIQRFSYFSGKGAE